MRGSAVPLLGFSYLLGKIDVADAVKVATAFNLAIGCIYPWNAAFISKLDTKPFHRVPEVLFVVLTALGALAL